MGDKNGLPNREEILEKLGGQAAGGGSGADEGGGGEETADDSAGAGADEGAGAAGEEAPDKGAAGAEAQPGADDPQKDKSGKAEGGDKPKLVPLSELQGERKRRQELEAKQKDYEARLAEFEKIKPEYQALMEFDKKMGVYFLNNPKELDRFKQGLAGKLNEAGDAATETADDIEAQIKEFGEADPRMVKLLQAQIAQTKAIQGRLDKFELGQTRKEQDQKTYAETQRHYSAFEAEIAQIEKENPDYAGDTDFIAAVIDIAAANNAESLLPIAKRLIDRDKSTADKALKKLAVKAPKKAGAGVEQGGGASGGPPIEQKPLSSDERLAQIMERYAIK